MSGSCYELCGVRVFECAAEGPALRSHQDAMALVEQAIAHGTTLIVIPIAKLHSDFFELQTRVAGEFLQKPVNYRLQVAIIGDIPQTASNSIPLQAFIRESNRGDQLWFLTDRGELERRLASRSKQPT